jgi:hypothetical protein
MPWKMIGSQVSNPSDALSHFNVKAPTISPYSASSLARWSGPGMFTEISLQTRTRSSPIEQDARLANDELKAGYIR